MSKQLLMSPSAFGTWLRRLRMAVAAYVGLVLLVAVVYVVAKLIGAEFSTLLVGVVGAIAALAVGAVAWGGIWLASLTQAQNDRIEQQRERLALLESSLQMLEVELEQKIAAVPAPVAPPPAESYPRIAVHESEPEPQRYGRAPQIPDEVAEAPAPSDVVTPPTPPPAFAPAEPELPAVNAIEPEFPPTTEYSPESEGAPAVEPPPAADLPPVEERIEQALASGDVRAARTLWEGLDGGVTSQQRSELQARVDALAADTAHQLRDEFAALVRAERFTDALRKGEEIVELVPDSRMSHDFAIIRPHLEARAADSASPPPAE